MRYLLSVLAVVASLTAPLPAQANPAEIQGVITSQIDAFKVDDFDTAFTYAAPGIQNMFRTPENFGRMVQGGYPMVWRPAEVTYLGTRSDGASVLQDVQIVDGDGRVFILEYRMDELADGWRISGVRLLETPEVAA